MTMRFLNVYVCVFAVLCVGTAQAQSGWEVGGGFGLAYYLGDLNTEYNLRHPKPAYQATVRYNFNNRLAWRLSGSYMRVVGDDQWSTNPFQLERNLHFRTPIFDLTSGLEFNFLEYEHAGDEWFTPYVYAGPCVYNFNPQSKYNGKWYNLRELGTEGQFLGEEYYATQLGLAFGGGMKWALTYRWALNLEVSGRFLATDYLDDVSTTYPDMGDLKALRGPIAPILSDPSAGPEKLGYEGRQRGDSRTRDTYAFATLKLVYFFGSVHCPKFL
jgi:opacity protein-like surface antigen